MFWLRHESQSNYWTIVAAINVFFFPYLYMRHYKFLIERSKNFILTTRGILYSISMTVVTCFFLLF